MRRFISIKKLLRATPLSDFYLVLTSPMERDSIRLNKKDQTTMEINQNFTDYVFHNLIISQKGKSYYGKQ